jgi:hypothetical protein
MGTVRWVVRAVLIALFVLLVPLSLLLLWARGAVLETDQYVRSVGPLAAEPAIQDAVARQVMGYLDRAVEGQTSSSSSLTQAALRRTYDSVRPTIEEAVREALASSQFQTVWAGGNRLAHDELVALLTGETGRLLTESDGEVTVDLTTVYEDVRARLQARGITVLDGVNPAPGELALTVFASRDLEQARRYTRLLHRLAYALPAAAVVVGLLYLVASPNRWRGLFWLGVALVVGAGLLWLLLAFGRSATVGTIQEPPARDAAETVYDAVLEPLVLWMVALAAAGAIVAVALLVARLVRGAAASS